MPVVHLTDIVVSRLKEPGTYFDKSTPAFGIRVGKNRKTWIVMRGRERTRTRIGRYPDLSLAKARKEALMLLGSPVQTQVEVLKFSEAAQQFFEIHVVTMRPNTQYQIKRIIKRYFAKPLREKRLDAITHHDITKVTDELAKRVPGEAYHVFAYIRIFFRWCVPRYIKHSPMEGLKSPSKYIPRKRVLTNLETVQVWRAADKVGYPFGIAIKLSLLWGTRWGETISCRRAFVDTQERTVTLPETKNGTQHCFPYGDLTADLLEAIPRFDDTDLLFPGRDGVSPWNGSGKAKWEMKEICSIAPWQLRDLRRTFATNLAALRVPPHVIEKLLNHVSGQISGVAAIYNRFQYRDEMREAIEKWEMHLSSLLASGAPQSAFETDENDLRIKALATIIA
jgi:integrase